jgi:hypothetical protein
MHKTVNKNGIDISSSFINQTKKYDDYNEYRILYITCSIDTSRNDIYKVFSKFGKIEELNINKTSNKSLGNNDY